MDCCRLAEGVRVPDAVQRLFSDALRPGPSLTQMHGPRLSSALLTRCAASGARTPNKSLTPALFFLTTLPALIARLPSRSKVNSPGAQLAAAAFVAWGGVSVAYRVALSAHAAPHDARYCSVPRQFASADAAGSIGRRPVRHVLRRSPEIAATSPAASEFFCRSAQSEPAACVAACRLRQ